MTNAALQAELDALQRATRSKTPGNIAGKIITAMLSASLTVKIIGANLVVAVAAAVAVVLTYQRGDASSVEPILVIASIAASVALSLLLIRVALAPLRDLQRTAEKVWMGQLDARVSPSRLASRRINRIGLTFNLVLDSLVADRNRARQLARDVIRAADRERDRIARELHDGAAQQCAALLFEVSALERRMVEPTSSKALSEVHGQVAEVLESLRAIAHSAYPRVLADLGLSAALRQLARESTDSATRVTAECTIGREIPIGVATVAFRVVEEAVRNALNHASASNIQIRAFVDSGTLQLEVMDDGIGFDTELASVSAGQALGIFSMKERVGLADGTFELSSVPGQGSSIRASLPTDGGAEL